jgi:hypothetical protein
MPFTDKIVGFINDSLKASSLKDKRFQPGRFIGIATPMARTLKSGQGVELLPASCDEQGNYKLIEPQEVPITVYHKIVSNAYTSARQANYGDEYVYKNTSEMQMIILADQRKVRLSSEQLEPLLIYGTPQRLSSALMQQLKFASCLVMPTGSTMDRIVVFRQEYQGIEYFLKPYHILFSIRYRIEATFDKNCINQCLCGSD